MNTSLSTTNPLNVHIFRFVYGDTAVQNDLDLFCDKLSVYQSFLEQKFVYHIHKSFDRLKLNTPNSVFLLLINAGMPDWWQYLHNLRDYGNGKYLPIHLTIFTPYDYAAHNQHKHDNGYPEITSQHFPNIHSEDGYTGLLTFLMFNMNRNKPDQYPERKGIYVYHGPNKTPSTIMQDYIAVEDPKGLMEYIKTIPHLFDEVYCILNLYLEKEFDANPLINYLCGLTESKKVLGILCNVIALTCKRSDRWWCINPEKDSITSQEKCAIARFIFTFSERQEGATVVEEKDGNLGDPQANITMSKLCDQYVSDEYLKAQEKHYEVMILAARMAMIHKRRLNNPKIHIELLYILCYTYLTLTKENQTGDDEESDLLHAIVRDYIIDLTLIKSAKNKGCFCFLGSTVRD